MSEPVYCAAAERLWELTQVDWHAAVSCTLTEPVCAVVTLSSDDDTLPELDQFIGNYDVNDSIRLACEYLLRNLAVFYQEHPERVPNGD